MTSERMARIGLTRRYFVVKVSVLHFNSYSCKTIRARGQDSNMSIALDYT